MRSIRRSMMLYLLGMFLATLAVIGVVIDRVAEAALAAREDAGAQLLQHQYEERCQREAERTNEALLNEARTLYGLMSALSQKNWIYNFLLRVGSQQLFHLAESAAAATGAWPPPFTIRLGQPGGPPPPPSVAFDTVRRLSQRVFANEPLPDEEFQHLIENSTDRGDYQQINEQFNDAAGREWHSPSLNGRKLRFEPREIDAKFFDHGKSPESAAPFDFAYDDKAIHEGQLVQMVILKAPHLGFQFGRGRGVPQPGGGGGPRLGPSLDNLPKLYIQCARPRAVIDAKFASFAWQRDIELARLSQEIHSSRTLMRIKMVAVGLVAMMALCVGGPLIVGTGLRPVGRLSDAVSRVSEKDFKLPHDGTDLAQELAPIHTGLTQTLDLLRRAFAREKQAVADISHELRTPIAALMATIDVALRKQRTQEQYRSALEECRLISKQLGQLVERIMTLATLDAGTDRTVISRVDALDLATGCAAVIRPLAEANGLSLAVHPADAAIELDTDQAKLREVLMNLLHNAVEYNRPGGSIDMAFHQEGATAVFEVRDTGIGVTPEVREKIFERFFRADPSRHATGVHAGLGLAIVKEYVARLHGTIRVESEPGVGTTFRVELPAILHSEDSTTPAHEPVAAVI